MNRDNKIWVLLLLGAAIAAIALLAISLPALELRPGEPLILPEEMRGMPGEREEIPPMPHGEIIDILLRAIFTFTLVLLPFAIIYLIISPESRKRALGTLITVLVITFLLMLLRPMVEGIEEEMEFGEEVPGKVPDGTLPAPDTEFTAEPSPGLILAVNILLALFLAAAVVAIVWFIWQHAHTRRSVRTVEDIPPMEQLAQEAQEAIGAVRSGVDLNDAVTRCYFEMTRILREQRGIHRQRAMTPREFETRLEEIGLPPEQIQRLTRLFERVRYGDKNPSEREEDQAIASLTAIVEFCRESP
ncbi:MAG: DUF4129 domain-containing protein [Anaerolineales bacterium]